MIAIYPHWQHGRLVEGCLLNATLGLPEIMDIYIAPVEALVVHLCGTPLGEPPRVPKITYELCWHDEHTAYFKMATRWRG